MEILIIGGIVVALMVLVSTKIKKNAAQAFESEIIETENFRLVKPAGFIHPLRDVTDYAFEAYSKEFGEKGQRNIWRAQAYITVSDGLNFNTERKNSKQKEDKILLDTVLKDAAEGEKICLMEKETSDDGSKYFEYRKIIESRKHQKTYNLKILVLAAFKDDFSGRAAELVNSFQLN